MQRRGKGGLARPLASVFLQKKGVVVVFVSNSKKHFSFLSADEGGGDDGEWTKGKGGRGTGIGGGKINCGYGRRLNGATANNEWATGKGRKK